MKMAGGLQVPENFSAFREDDLKILYSDSRELKNDSHQCQKCSIVFNKEEDIKSHISVHDDTDDCLTRPEISLRRELLYEEVRKQQDEDLQRAKAAGNPVQKPRRIYKPKSKRVGFTKIKMEDCLRCDACSCIYIDPKDYYKHMRNFHQRYNTVIPRSRRKTSEQFTYGTNPINSISQPLFHFEQTEEGNESADCTKNYGKDPLVLPQFNDFSDPNIREHIKNRWSKVVSERLVSPVKIKDEPSDEEDLSYLLSHVEVKIKTESIDQ